MAHDAGLAPGLAEPPVSEEDAEAYVASICFKTGPPGRVGVEIERLVHASTDPRAPVPVPHLRSVLAPVLAPLGGGLPGGGTLSLEPGGQLEVSSACAQGPAELLPRSRADLAAVDRLLGAAGLAPGTLALDPHRPPHPSLEHPRYAAMQRYFDAEGPSGRTMMCSTVSLQTCLEAGSTEAQARERWERLHRLLPVLVAMFANSPFHHGRPTGWKSTRLRVWSHIDPARTAPVPMRQPGLDPAEAWARYALDAPLMCMRVAGERAWDAPPGLTLRQWLRTGMPRRATLADVDYHLTTLFPPVRPRGFLELRAIDAQAGTEWEPAAAIITALMDDDGAARAADEACGALGAFEGRFDTAARWGLDNPLLATAAARCAEAAIAALPSLGADGAGQRSATAFAEAYTFRGRCPADARLERWQRTGELYAAPNQSPYEDPECEEAS
ncbi:MAG: ergothioneine biosynthesis glutamate--cysteine ligase EgtA [Sinomonas sp.]|nr:ergothioneine biosynthesis glutamate--cysteine ligase EgtA [Sinomonas sp.]